MADLIGGAWLAQTYNAEPFGGLVVQSQIGGRRAHFAHGLHITEIYPETMRPADTPAAHLQFHLRYEPTSLELLTRLFTQTGPAFIQDWVNTTPTGQYARRAAFLYEFLTGDELIPPQGLAGRYIPALNPDLMITASAQKTRNVSRWRVRDNMPGTRFFCPLIPRTTSLDTAMEQDISAGYDALVQQFGEEMLARAAIWLTTRESKASFTIEGEADQLSSIQRFSHILATQTGRGPSPLTDTALAALQRSILGPVTTAEHFGLRLSPVFVGEVTRYQDNIIHYFAPPASDIPAMLEGMKLFLERTEGQSPIMRCAVLSFGFVYIHPLSDGNGRMHRFLINDMLRRDGAIPDNVILPVSATIIGDATSKHAYDHILETVSQPLMERISDFITLENPAIIYPDGIRSTLHYDDQRARAEPAWRFINFAPHIIYLSQILEQTITRHVREEARYLTAHRSARQAIKALIEMPNEEADRLIRSLSQNHFQPSGKIKKEYPAISKFNLWEQIATAIRQSFTS